MLTPSGKHGFRLYCSLLTKLPQISARPQRPERVFVLSGPEDMLLTGFFRALRRMRHLLSSRLL
jgi:hypothetical protein